MPRVPVPESRRGRAHQVQWDDAQEGRLRDRVFDFPFDPIASGASAQFSLRIMSMGSRYIVVPALRGSLLFSSRSNGLTGLELAQLQLRLQLNAEDDWIQDGQGGNTASLAALFGSSDSPWFWFEHPPRLRAGDNLIATITNTMVDHGAPTLQPELSLRMMDAARYWDMYGRLMDPRDATEGDLFVEGVV